LAIATQQARVMRCLWGMVVEEGVVRCWGWSEMEEGGCWQYWLSRILAKVAEIHAKIQRQTCKSFSRPLWKTV
jgi:hypothetical protein